MRLIRHITLLFFLVSILFILGIGCTNSKVDENQTRAIGCITALTGNDANYGRSTKQGLDLALDEINADLEHDGKSFRYNIIYEDDQMSPKNGPAAFQKLVTANKVPLIIGPFGSKVVLAVAPLAEQEKIVIVSASATSDNIADAGDFIFRTVPANRDQARDCEAFVRTKLGAKTASVLYVKDDYGMTLKSAFIEFFTKNGGTIVSEDSYESQATDFRTQLTRIKEKKPDVVFFPGYYKEPAQILKQAADLGLFELGIKFIGTDGSCTDDLIRIAGKSAEGTFFSNLAADFKGTSPQMQAFIKAFQQKYNGQPDAYSAYYFDTLKMLSSVLNSIKWDSKDQIGTSERIKAALYSMPEYNGITGPTKFDKRGEVEKPFAIMVVKNGRFELSH